jgi:uncharacterized protein YjaG (DUF416 family)
MLNHKIILIFLSLILVSCNGANIKHQVKTLEDAITEYNTGLRWAMYNNVDAYGKSSDGTHTPVDREALKNIRITGYEVIEKHVNDDATEAIVKGEISYYSNEYGTLRKVDFEQTWWYDAESKHWFVEGALPKFK